LRSCDAEPWIASLALAMTVSTASSWLFEIRIGNLRCCRPGQGRCVLPQQNRVGAVHGIGAVHHCAFQRWRLHRDVLGEKSRQCDMTQGIARASSEIARGKRFACEHAAAERRSKKPEI